MKMLEFADCMIPYDRFLSDIANKVVCMIKSDHNDPEFVSQRKAWQIFGRNNVERWRRQGKVTPCKRPGRLEYRTAELRLLQRVEQDYFDE